MSTSTNRNKGKSVHAGASTRGGVGASVVSRKGVPAQSVESQSRIRKTQYGSSSRTILSSGSRGRVQVGASDKAGGPNKTPVQVIDENGQDVTPLPLLQLDRSQVRKNQSNILADSSGGTPTDLMSQASIYQAGTITASTFGGGPFTRSVFSASQSGRSTGSLGDDLAEPSQDLSAAWAEIRHKREEVKEDLTEEDLEKIIEVNLTETDTIWLLDMPGVCVSMEGDEAPEVREKNTRYEELLKTRVGNDRYMERGMNTFNNAPKLKSIQTTRIGYNDVGVYATNWDMHDTFETAAEMEAKAKEEGEQDEEDEGTVSRPVSAAQITDTEKKDTASEKEEIPPTGLTASMIKESTQKSGRESRGTMSSATGTESLFASKESGVASVPEQTQSHDQEILKSEQLKSDLVTMERAVNLNTYQPKQASYRGFSIIPDIDKVVEEIKPKAGGQINVTDMGPNLDRLWAYQCPLTKSRNVSCMSWNKVNADLLAVGYGQYEYTSQKSGLVCCWSLKNPEYAERIYTCPHGVTSMDFSVVHPNLLAVGLYDGTVAVYNVRSTNNEPVLDSFESHGKHTAPVWQVKWIEKDRGSGEEGTEVLVSISTDGRVTQWSIRKGFESSDLMKLKRVASKTQATAGGTTKSREKKGEAFISRHAGGLCFDFCARDSNIYLAGTEEGHIHRCSCSYNEQYLDTYFGHTGPVYKIQWSPFNPEVFLSCSGDWTTRLWHQDKLNPAVTFISSTKAAHDVSWSPRNATVFACVNEGAVEVWDLAQSTLDPIIVNNPMPGIKLSTVTFAKNTECVLVGDSEGQVTVYQLRCMLEPAKKQVDILNKLVVGSPAASKATTNDERNDDDTEEDV